MTTHTILAPRESVEPPPPPSKVFEYTQTRRMMFGAVIVLYFICCFSIALTRAPWYDEGFVVNPAYAWITTGHPGVSILDDSGPFLPFRQRVSMRGIREHLYLEMPLHMVFLAAWFKILGFGLVRARLFTILCGVVVLLSWYSIVRRLTMDAAVAFASFALTAMDYGFVLRASEARMDTLSAAFGFGALAVYLALRERNFTQGVLWSHTCVAASVFTHPNGGMLAFVALAFLTLYLDRQRIQIRHVAVALGPYMVAAACWGIYISKDLNSFKAQFVMNSVQGGRLRTFGAPWENLRREIVERYLGTLGGAGDPSGSKRLKLIVPISYFAGLVTVSSVSSLRRRQGYFILLALAVIYFFVLAFTDGRKSQCYIVHIIPVYTALLGASLVWLWQKGRGYRAVTAALVLVLCAIHLGGISYQARADTYHRSYLPIVHFLQANTAPTQTIIGPGILGLGLHYPPDLTDDFRLGFLSGQTPDWIVVNDWYESWFRVLGKIEPDAYQFVRNRLDHQYTPAYRHAGFVVYRRTSPAT